METKSQTERNILWTCPRCISTAFERAFIERGDCHVYHEPFGVPHYYGKEARTKRKAFLDQERSDVTYEEMFQKVFHDPPKAGKKYVFAKDFPYQIDVNLVPLDKEMSHSLLIRHPAKAIKSLYQKTGIEHISGFDYFDPAEAGYTDIYKLWKMLLKAGHKVTIVDADELLLDPAGVMEAYCESTGILPYSDKMLTWKKGPIPDWDCWAGWHDDALESTGLMKRDKISPIPDVSKMPEEVQKCIEEALPLYEEMYANRVLAKKD